MKTYLFKITIGIILFIVLISCKKDDSSTSTEIELTGPYLGQEPPGTSPKVFAPGFISMSSTSEYACTFSPNGDEFYFTRATSTSQRIYVSRLINNVWTVPQPTDFSNEYNSHEPHLMFDNQTIYFGWFRSVPSGEVSYVGNYGIWASDRTESGWSAARYVGQGMFVSSTSDGQLFVTDISVPNTAYLSKVTITNGRFTNLEHLSGGMETIRTTFGSTAHPCIAPDGSYIVYDTGNQPLFVSFKQNNGTWGSAIYLSQHGISSKANIASISPDGKYLFFADAGDIYWVSTDLIKNLNIKK